MQSSGQPLFIEIFAGRGSLSKAAIQTGFSVLSIDHESGASVVPIVQLDLTSPGGEAILWDMLGITAAVGSAPWATLRHS